MLPPESFLSLHFSVLLPPFLRRPTVIAFVSCFPFLPCQVRHNLIFFFFSFVKLNSEIVFYSEFLLFQLLVEVPLVAIRLNA